MGQQNKVSRWALKTFFLQQPQHRAFSIPFPTPFRHSVLSHSLCTFTFNHLVRFDLPAKSSTVLDTINFAERRPWHHNVLSLCDCFTPINLVFVAFSISRQRRPPCFHNSLLCSLNCTVVLHCILLDLFLIIYCNLSSRGLFCIFCSVLFCLWGILADFKSRGPSKSHTRIVGMMEKISREKFQFRVFFFGKVFLLQVCCFFFLFSGRESEKINLYCACWMCIV